MDNLIEDDTIKLMIDEAAGDIDNVPLPSDNDSIVGSVLNEQLNEQLATLGMKVSNV